MACGLSIDSMTFDLAWPWKVKSRSRNFWSQISRKWCKIRGWSQWRSDRKSHMGYRDDFYLFIPIFFKSVRCRMYGLWFQLQPFKSERASRTGWAPSSCCLRQGISSMGNWLGRPFEENFPRQYLRYNSDRISDEVSTFRFQKMHRWYYNLYI